MIGRLLLKCYLQGTAASVFVNLDPFSKTEFVINRLKRAGNRDWIASRPAIGKSIIKKEKSLQQLVDVVSSISGVWRLVVFYLKETGQKDHGNSLVLRFSVLDNNICGFIMHS